MLHLATELKRFDRTMRKLVLPFWATLGFDARSGLFYERLDVRGYPERAVPRRMMVQARQVHVYANAARAGIYLEGAGSAVRALDTALRCYADDQDLTRGLAFSIDEAGRVENPIRESYCHAFALFALAAVLRLTGERRYRRAIEDLVCFVEYHLADRIYGGYFSHYPAAMAGKMQNPTMHMLEAYLALHEAWPERDFIRQAGAIVALFERLTENAVGLLLEHYAADWTPCLTEPNGRVFEPGHQYELAWLMCWYDHLAGADHCRLAERLWRAATDHGRDKFGLCFDEVSIGLRPTKQTKRLWPHCEGARATACRRAIGEMRASTVLAEMVGHLNRSFVGRPFSAGWIDRLDVAGNPQPGPVPASSLYHLYGVLTEVEADVSAEGFAPAATGRELKLC
jgi:mannose-6-phosphate isomerase